MGDRQGVVWPVAALAPPLVAFICQWALWPLIDPLVWFLFYPAVFISSWLGGRRAGVLATLLCIALAWGFFIPREPSVASSQFFSTGAFFAMGVLFGVFHEQLRAATRRSEAVVQGALDCVIAMDEKGRVTEWNPAATQTFGFARDEALGCELADLIIPEALRARHRAGLERRVHGGGGTILGRRIEMQAVTKDAREIPVELSVTQIPSGTPPSFVGFVRDISARRKAESEKSRQLEAQRLLDQTTLALASSLDISETLQKAARLTVPRFGDWCAVDLVDDSSELRPAAVAHTDRTGETLVPGLLREGAEQVFVGRELVLRPSSDGAHFYLGAPIRCGERMLGVLSLLRERSYDASDLGLAEELARRIGLAVDNARLYLEAQDAIRVRDEFLQVASHELKTPLTPLQLQLDTLARAFEKRGIDDPRVLERLKSATRQTLRLGRLVESLLDVSRISGGRLTLNPEPGDLSVLVWDVAQRYQAEAHRAGSQIEVSADAPVMGSWDSARVKQIVANLLSNAIKYGSGNPIELDVRPSDETVRVTVTDRGIGMSAEVLARIFDRFERGVSLRHYGGLGLGLYIARRFAEAHGGTLLATSRPGLGSTFTLVLPRLMKGQLDEDTRDTDGAKP
jgi:PAS domain S-box-containing protein